jgi:hypothetical protein
VLSAQHLLAVWKNGGDSSACQRQWPGGACRRRLRGEEAAAARLGESSCTPCRLCSTALVVIPEIQQVTEAHGVERQEEEAVNVPKQQEKVEQLLWEHQLRVARRETHTGHDRGRACPDLLAFLGVFVPLGLRQWWASPPEQIGMSGREDRSHCTRGFF